MKHLDSNNIIWLILYSLEISVFRYSSLMRSGNTL